MRVLWKVGWQHLARKPWQSLLMITGIALGVAVAVSIDVANTSASRAFDLSTEAIAGRATHQIGGGSLGVEERIYTHLIRSGIDLAATPVITEYVTSDQLGGYPIQLIGVDPFTEGDFRELFGSQELLVEQLTTFLTVPGAVLITNDLADRFGLQDCAGFRTPPASKCRISLVINGKKQTATVVGILEGGQNRSGSGTRQTVGEVLLADISTAQELTGRTGRLERIDLVLPETCRLMDDREAGDCQTIREIRSLLPPDLVITPASDRTETIDEMTSAFRLNLTALSLLALVVGMFLIYNTMTFSVVQRRPLFGTLRCLGVTRTEVFRLMAAEAFLLGLLGSVLGVLLGILLGQGAVEMVTRTINDLYFVVNVQGVQIPLSSLVKGAILGVGATLLSAAPPAWEAASVPPRAALTRSSLESKTRRAVRIAALSGLVLALTGALVLALPTRNLVVSFGGTFGVIIGLAMMAPLATESLLNPASLAFGRIWGTIGRLAPKNVIGGLSRTAVAIAALTVAVSVTIGVTLMVTSFRQTVVTWLDQTLQGDIYISPPSLSSAQPTAVIDPQVREAVEDIPGVRRVDVLRSVDLNSSLGNIHIAATDNPEIASERLFVSSIGPPEEIGEALQGGSVLVSEPFANRFNIPSEGATLSISTGSGFKSFPVAGIYRDYASSRGTVLMTLENYQANWPDKAINTMAVRLEAGVDTELTSQALREELSRYQDLIIRPNRVLRQEALEVFDRTFTITGALQFLATLVAFIGIVAALLSLQLEKQRELGILRAVGLTTRQLWSLIMVESGLIGLAAGILSLPVGFILAWILIYIINQRSFGWTLQMHLTWEPFAQALLVASAAALVAAAYPALKISRMWAAEALRSE